MASQNCFPRLLQLRSGVPIEGPDQGLISILKIGLDSIKKVFCEHGWSSVREILTIE